MLDDVAGWLEIKETLRELVGEVREAEALVARARLFVCSQVMRDAADRAGLGKEWDAWIADSGRFVSSIKKIIPPRAGQETRHE